MRLHELTATAFGPFVETVRVDFDELTTGGLFLLTGATGAGKSSILDAVCFALYGEVPGERHAARHLRSDHAAPEAEPSVVLRLSIGERTFRFTRSPAWDRPRRRGEGTRRIQAHVVVEEQRAEGWTTLTNRLDEAGHLVTDLLGMTCTQFTQVAMLPQGRFQTFLRASSAERHAVLQRLFRTRRFEDVERWLVDRRVRLRRRSQQGQEASTAVLHRFQEAAGVGTPEEWGASGAGDIDDVAEDGRLLTWSRDVTDRVRAQHDAAATTLAVATQRSVETAEALERGVGQAQARARGERAARVLAELASTQDHEDDTRRTLDRHLRSEPVLRLADRADVARADADTALAESELRVAAAAPLLGVDPGAVDVGLVRAATHRVREARAVATSWLPREHELEDERARRVRLTADVARLRTTVAQAEERRSGQQPRRAALLEELDRARELGARRPQDRAARDHARTALEAARQEEELQTRLAHDRRALETATTRAQDLREHYLDVREQRISGMAAELAGGLAVGCSCPVCGSADHPAPASATGQVGRDDEDAARSLHESADFERQTLREVVTTLDAQLAAARQHTEGHDVAHWRASLQRAATALDHSSAAEAEVELLRDQLERLDLDALRTADALASARATLEARSEEEAAATERVERLGAELAALLIGHDDVETVAQLVESLGRQTTVLEAALDSLQRAARAAEQLSSAQEQADEAARHAGFDSVGHACEVAVPDLVATRLRSELESRTAQRAAAESALAEDVVTHALAAPAVDLDDLRARVRTMTAERDAAHADRTQLERRLLRLDDLAAELEQALAAWAPTRREHALVAGLSSLVEGTSADNRLRMRLSAYVLSERLRQVVAAANERLAGMTDERYSLEQSDEKGAGEQRGGLSLRVRDEWSGKERDPATLSGGETFLVSLALALGLADTVSHEAGGTQLDTLFIDEGFGALDAGTLDGVMDTLDSLRDGGRVVGLVSHVAELRNRVTAQLEVRKARQGSTVALVLADG